MRGVKTMETKTIHSPKPKVTTVKPSTEADTTKSTEPKIKEIEDLPGVGPTTADKLREAGRRTIMNIAIATPSEISDIGGLGESAARRAINAARSALNMGFQSADILLEKRKEIRKISTGSNNLNALVGGGFETGAIVECFGQYASGKTQIAHVLAITNYKEDPESYTVFIDTENTFRPERIVQIAKGAGLNPDDVLKHTKVARAFNSDHQMLLTEKVSELIDEQGLKVGVVIVDSLTGHFRAEFIGRGTLAERQQKLNRHMHALQRLATSYNLCVYVTNQVMVKPDVFFGDPTQAIGGHIVAHASTFRIYLRRGKKGSRVAKLVDSPNLPEAEASFMITEEGLKDF